MTISTPIFSAEEIEAREESSKSLGICGEEEENIELGNREKTCSPSSLNQGNSNTKLGVGEEIPSPSSLKRGPNSSSVGFHRPSILKKSSISEVCIEEDVSATQNEDGMDQINQAVARSANQSHSFSKTPTYQHKRRSATASITEPANEHLSGAVKNHRSKRTMFRQPRERQHSLLGSVLSFFRKANDANEEDKYVPLPASTNTFMHTEPVHSLPFLVSIAVAALSVFSMGLVLYNSVGHGVWLDVPAGVGGDVRCAQYCGEFALSLCNIAAKIINLSVYYRSLRRNPCWADYGGRNTARAQSSTICFEGIIQGIISRSIVFALRLV